MNKTTTLTCGKCGEKFESETEQDSDEYCPNCLSETKSKPQVPLIHCNIKLSDFPNQCEFKNQKHLDQTYTELLTELEDDTISKSNLIEWKQNNETKIPLLKDSETKETLQLQNKIYDLLLCDCWHFKHNLCSYQNPRHCNKKKTNKETIICPKESKTQKVRRTIKEKEI